VTREKLRARKQQVVRDAIHDAGIRLFAVKGFDQTTVDEIAEAAGISRRSFFHYYASKDDLLSQGFAEYTAALVDALRACPTTLSAVKVLHETVLGGIKFVAVQSHLRQVLEIASASKAARQAYGSRSIDVEDSLTAAYAQHLKRSLRSGDEPELLAHLTMLVMRVSISRWFIGEYQDLSTSAKHVLTNLTRLTKNEADSVRTRIKALDSPKLVNSSNSSRTSQPRRQKS
jgi:AcrR family transcriptional regulator